MESKKINKILDSVHGYIPVPEDIMLGIIDTPYFQRLKRIEQTSGRVLFPCAHHDRFSHSLGVYHMGCRIIESLWHRCITQFPNYKETAITTYSYILACLLHDVGHTPFSHTFENSYANDNNDLRHVLIQETKAYDSSFDEDFIQQWSEAAPHEMISAYVVLKCFKEFISQPHDWELIGTSIYADIALIVRMIVGCKYKNKQQSFRNAFIELLHSSVIDADGLDYVSRDAWASGYATANVDVTRLVDSIYVCLNDEEYVLCYDVKAIQEIKAAIMVKNFQQNNIITHRVVSYEQTLLVKAMESAALAYYQGDPNNANQTERDAALHKLCSLKDFILPEGSVPAGHIVLPTDDDFVYLMKQIPHNQYVSEWLSRTYKLHPLWKSRERFLIYFNKFKLETFNDRCWMFSEKGAKSFIAQRFNIDPNSIWVIKGTPRNKLSKITGLKILINKKDIFDYKSIYSDTNLKSSELLSCFDYIFIPSFDKDRHPIDDEEIRSAVREECWRQIQ